MRGKNSPLKETHEHIDRVLDEISKIRGKMKTFVKNAKEKFDSADERTKKRIITGLAGATAVLAAIVGAKKISRKRKKHK